MPPSAEPFPADWYPDPDDPTQVRYWDGHRWIAHVAVRDALLTPVVGKTPPPPGTQPDPEDATPASGGGRLEKSAAPRSKLVATVALITPVLGFFLPFFGPWASAGAVIQSRRRPWPWVAGGFAVGLAYDLTMVVAAIPTIS